MRMRRCKVLSVDPELLYGVFHRAMFNDTPIDGVLRMHGDVVPQDATLVRADFHHESGCVRFLLTHPSFDEVPDGQMYPLLLPMFSIERTEAAA